MELFALADRLSQAKFRMGRSNTTRHLFGAEYGNGISMSGFRLRDRLQPPSLVRVRPIDPRQNRGVWRNEPLQRRRDLARRIGLHTFNRRL